MFRVAGSISSSPVLSAMLLIAMGFTVPTCSADAPKSGEPTDPKARSTYNEALGWLKKGDKALALSEFRKANKQDGGHCAECLRRAYSLANSIGAYKDAADVARDWLLIAQTDVDKAALHYRIGIALQQEGTATKKDKWFSESCDEFKAALQLAPRFTAVHYSWGVSLAYLHQDDAARAEFSSYIGEDQANPAAHERAGRYIERIELARARMAPPFSATTIDGEHITMDSLAGKVVLIDFWATWCGPCRNALPHIRQIVKKFEGQPLVVLSISVDKDRDKWKSFVGENGMTWLQYCDGGFGGEVARLFGVNAIPATFSIDADGVLEDQHVGDADIEGKLKKMIARAMEVRSRKPLPAASQAEAESPN
jgi:thiol-disulfide isomerase/thioredoxin/Tfp pilus assembly protein PilF